MTLDINLVIHIKLMNDDNLYFFDLINDDKLQDYEKNIQKN